MRKSQLITEEPKFISPHSYLAKFFRKILYELNITPGKFEQLAARRAEKTKSKYKHKKKLYQSQIINTLTSDSLTWRNFMLGIFELLSVKKMVVTVKLHHENGQVTEHEIEITRNDSE